MANNKRIEKENGKGFFYNPVFQLYIFLLLFFFRIKKTRELYVVRIDDQELGFGFIAIICCTIATNRLLL